jgi:hypothetical protein
MDDKLSKLSFNKSSFTIVLNVLSVFMSAYPGFIVFGKSDSQSYEEKSYFKFCPFELYKLYIAIIQILKFFTEENPQITKSLILVRNKCDKIVYFWNGTTLMINEKEEKFISFGIETEDRTLKIDMTLLEVHNLINALKSTILISLCLTNSEIEILIKASDLQLSSLKTLKNYCDTKTFVESYLKTNSTNLKEEDTYKLTQLILYYYDIILLIHKFSTMCQFEENISEQILSAK